MIEVVIRHAGLADRTLSASGLRRHTMLDRRSIENEVVSKVTFELGTVEAELVELTKAALNPLFALYDYFEPADTLYDEIVSAFREGRVV